MIHLIRHAQAGSRDNYDLLSPLGEEQARRLGAYLAQELEQVAVLSGTMQRQRRTAELVCESFNRSHSDVDELLNEFSLASLYGAFVQRMIEERPDFERDFREMQEALRRDPHTVRGATGRCDIAMIRAWINNQYPDYQGESWAAFRQRIESRIPHLAEASGCAELIVITSATPIAIVTAAALGLTDEKLVGILGLIYNSGITSLRIKNGELRLFTFNATPHLTSKLRTFR